MSVIYVEDSPMNYIVKAIELRWLPDREVREGLGLCGKIYYKIICTHSVTGKVFVTERENDWLPVAAMQWEAEPEKYSAEIGVLLDKWGFSLNTERGIDLFNPFTLEPIPDESNEQASGDDVPSEPVSTQS